ncbi:50S ribosomal protein L29 [mine drainage metagenome]|uniref:50S ribosomal protein L29 n=1 Tax=mine drainage metagenome TaxID=410659 RepID=T1ABQ8_9ZZZZ
MKTTNRRTLTAEQLQAAWLEQKRALVKLRIERGVGQLAKPHQIRDARREVARILTLLGERRRLPERTS